MTKTSYLIFISEGDYLIDNTCLASVEKELAGQSGDELFFVIQTDGGNPFSAVAIMNIVRKKFKKVNMLIPESAYSAGTLMALGSDIIYMTDKSALGPLDLPMEHPKDATRISALDFHSTITTLSSLSQTIAKSIYTVLRDEKERIKLPKKEAAKLAFKTSTDFVSPVVDKIDPYHLQKAYRELKIAQRYAQSLLSKAMMKDDKIQAIITSRAIVNNYPAHEYCIFSEEAKEELKLDVRDLETLDQWKNIKKDFNEHNKKWRSIKYIEKEKNEPTAKTNKK